MKSSEIKVLKQMLKDPESVMVNMIRGDIAKLSVRQFVKTQGGEIINTDEAQLLEIARLREELAETKTQLGHATMQADIVLSNRDRVRSLLGLQVGDDIIECVRALNSVVIAATEIVIGYNGAERERGMPYSETYLSPLTQTVQENSLTVRVKYLNRLRRYVNALSLTKNTRGIQP